MKKPSRPRKPRFRSERKGKPVKKASRLRKPAFRSQRSEKPGSGSRRNSWLPVLILRFVDPTTSAFMLIRRAQGFQIDMRWRPLEAVAPVLPVAVVAAED